MVVIKKIWKLILVIAAICLVAGVFFARRFLPTSATIIGKKASAFSLRDTKGDLVDTSVFIGKKPLVLFFWTTWCPHCRRQINFLKQEAKNIQGASAEIILVDVDESSSQVSGFLSSINSPFESLLDPEARISGEYLVIGVPTFVIVGSDGIIKFHDNLLPGDYQKFLTAE